MLSLSTKCLRPTPHRAPPLLGVIHLEMRSFEFTNMENNEQRMTEVTNPTAPVEGETMAQESGRTPRRRHRPSRAAHAPEATPLPLTSEPAPTATPAAENVPAAQENGATRNPRGRRGGRRANTKNVEDTVAAHTMDSTAEDTSVTNSSVTPPLAAEVPPVPTSAPVADESTNRPQRRYRFDRPPTTPTSAPAPTESRRLGPFATLFGQRAPAAISEDLQSTNSELFPEASAAIEEDLAEEIIPADQDFVVIPDAELEMIETQTEEEENVLDILDADAQSDDAEDASVSASEAQSSRRRRRRRGSGNSSNGHAPVTPADLLATELRSMTSAPSAAKPTAQASAPKSTPTPTLPPTTINESIYQAPTYPQTPTYPPPSAPPPAMPAPTAEPPSVYGSPEPSYARGFGPTPRGVASEFRVAPPTRVRQERDTGAPISPNHLATVITSAIQQQTDRFIAESRRQNNTPMFTIAMPSTERVGIFVDVANLLYSSRSMRIPIDFGKLLTFLRNERRLIRAHAYCPTSPEPYADQAFLQAVKGLGYRITTKDYKTFSSGAKKADLDLDLCMDIVRIVDAGAVDTVVLVSGDSDFLPLLDYCSDHGVRVEVAAFDESTAAILRQSCDLFLNLSLVEDIRA